MSTRKVLIIVVVVELLIILLGISIQGMTIGAAQLITLYSGRFSLMLFSLIFILQDKPKHLVRAILSKPYSAFALAHGIHLIEVFTYRVQAPEGLVPVRLVGGFVAYVFIFIMPYLVHRFDQGKIFEKHFKIIENIYLFYVWFMFFMVYLSRVRGTVPIETDRLQEYVILLGWVSLLLGMRFSSMILTTRRRSN